MRRIAWRRVFLVAALLGVLIYLVYVLISSTGNKILCNRIEVDIINDSEVNLVSRDDVKDIIKTCGIPVFNQVLDEIPVGKIQKLLASKSYIRSVYVYTTGDGALNINLEQRKPVVRVSTRRGGFYMDDDSFVFPLSYKYTPSLPIVTGNIVSPYPNNKGVLPSNLNGAFLREIIDFANFIQQDVFWNAEIQQINVIQINNIELITSTGDHIVRFGDLLDYKYKLNKLMTFYSKVLPIEGWGKYRQIDLRFSNQVVATLR